MLTSAIVVVVAILTPVIGPFTFYGTAAPYLGPVLPRPDGVPKTAVASYSWKGFGLFWKWETKFSKGCASWGATENPDYFDVRLVSGESGCSSVGIPLRYASHSDEIVFGQGGRWSGGEPCPFKVSREQLTAFSELIYEGKTTAHKDIELPALNQIETRLDKVDGQRLTTDHSGGCNDLSPSDYGKP